ncbi:MAG TPA: SRPBCC family protein [Egibacteraceae bacterium]|nr:SRPBCC family protein [Egibacteraceae bacterium]
MIEITQSTLIDRPVEEVFKLAGDPSNDETWATVMVETRQVSAGPIEKGTMLVQVMRFLGKRLETQCEVTEYEQDSRVAFSMALGPNRGTHERTFEEVDGGTRITLVTRGDSTGLFKLADPVLKRMATKQMAADLAILKELLEAGEPAAG